MSGNPVLSTMASVYVSPLPHPEKNFNFMIIVNWLCYFNGLSTKLLLNYLAADNVNDRNAF